MARKRKRIRTHKKLEIFGKKVPVFGTGSRKRKRR